MIVETNLVQEVHQQHLRVTLSTITRTGLLSRLSTLDNHNIWNHMPRGLI